MKNKIVEHNNTSQTKSKFFKIAVSVLGILIFCSLCFLILKWTGILDRFDSVEEVSEFIKNSGIYGLLVFFVLQFLQVTILPLPGFITTVAGSIVFGPLYSAIASSFAIILGSLFAFYLGRKFGTKLLIWCVGKEDTEHYKSILTECKYAFFIMMLFPFFPDDILCIVAGVTNMSNKFFIITNLITRPVSVFCTRFIGSGYLIPFKGWGIYVWILFVILLILVLLLSTKYQKKIEDFILKIDKKLKRKKRKKRKQKN
ncbi:MAG: TVP38/TMEM64 family protein [Clostridia bacterium]|nr:TVP38/TMEM64 family protein [Clostridia bacterium]